MRIGVQTFFGGHEREPLADYIIGVGQALEDRGFGAIWVSEHAVTFRDYDPAYPYPYADDGTPPSGFDQIGMIDPMSALTVLATHTSKLRLSPGIAILPQRNPVYFAQMATAIDLLSNGRFVAGVGLGWSKQEFDACNVPFEHRGSRMADYIEVIKSLWCDDVSSFEGKYYALPECVQLPKPLSQPHPPFFFGGESKPAMRRVAKYGQGWVAFRQTPEELAERMPMLDATLAEYGRSRADIEIIVSPGNDRECDAGMIERYAALGVSEVVVVCLGDSLDTFRANADALAKELIG